VSQLLTIIGFGAVTAVGFNAPQSCAAIRAAITGFTLAECRDKVKGPTLHAEVPLRPRPFEATPFSRLVALAATALRECVESSGLDPRRWVLLLGVREYFRVVPGYDWRNSSLLNVIQQASGCSFHPDSRVIPEGNAATFSALAQARVLLASKNVEGCVVGGVDSLLNTADVKRFGGRYRLKSNEVARGFIPGEGAAFVAVASKSTVSQYGMINGIGLAKEGELTTVLSSGHPNGKGLASAIRAALSDAGIDESQVHFRVSDMNGELYRGHESMLALTRVYRTRRPNFPQILPAACVGEIGAAAGALLLVVAATSIYRGYAPGRIAICEGSSDGGLRGACLVVGG
jgi:3-oxoacyl-[acyl-carrier-protein] synthase-1